MSKTVKKKTLKDGSVLQLITWISDSIRPGRRMHRLSLADGLTTISHPPDFENFSKAEIYTMYQKINSGEEFTELFRTAAG